MKIKTLMDESGSRNVREVTNQLYGMMDDGILDPRTVANAALFYMSERDVAEMARINELMPNDLDYDD